MSLTRRRLGPSLVLVLALAACTDGKLFGSLALPGAAPSAPASAAAPLAGPGGGIAAKTLVDGKDLKVIQQPLAKGVKAQLRLPYKTFYMPPGSVYQMKAQLLVADPQAAPIVTWTSSNPKAVTVDRGMLRSLAAGETTITVEALGQKATMVVQIVGKIDAAGTVFGGSGSTGGTDAGAGGTKLIEAAPGEAGELTYARIGNFAMMYNSGTAILVLGGSDGKKALNSKEAAPFVRTGDGGNLAIDTVFALERNHLFATPREGLTAMFAGAHLYVLGGTAERAVERLDADKADPFVDSGVSLSVPRSYHAQVDDSRFVVLVGGENASGSPIADVETATKAQTSDRDTTALGSFSAQPSMIRPRTGLGVGRAGGFIYAIGGNTADGPTDSIERATLGNDGVVGSWSDLEIKLREPRAYHAVVTTGSYIYVIGGIGPDGTPRDTIERVSATAGQPISSQFELVGRLSKARSRHGATYSGNTLIVTGGRTAAGATRDVEFIDVQSLSPEAFARPSGSPSPSATPTAAATASPTPRPTASATATATPTATPTASPTPTATPTATPTPSPTPTPTATPTPTP